MLRLSVTAGILGFVAMAQSIPQPPTLRFDVASVRVNRAAGCRGRWDLRASNGIVIAENAPLLRIVSRAFHLTDDRVLGPAWMESECYDIQAKTSMTEASERDLMTMLQELLRERLLLQAHFESGERPIFALSPDRGGVKFGSDDDILEQRPPTGSGQVLFMARTLQDLCERLGSVTGRPVVDKTGLSGRYVIVLSYVPLAAANAEPAGPGADVFAAVRDQLGLRLEAERDVVQILKVDSVEKVPSEN